MTIFENFEILYKKNGIFEILYKNGNLKNF